MMLNVYALKDKKAGCFIPQIMFYDNDEVAKRGLYEMYKTSCDKSPHSPLASYPEDFELYRIGYFETVSGEIDTDVNFICSANAFYCEV